MLILKDIRITDCNFNKAWYNERQKNEKGKRADKVTIILPSFSTFSRLTRLEAVFPLSNGALCGILKKV